MIDTAVKHFKSGGVVIFPTDTLYGVGCAINKEYSIKRLYKIRRNPANKPSVILVKDLDQALSYGYFNKKALVLAKNFWPGPLTIIVQGKPTVPKTIRGEGGSIAIRVPKQPELLKIIEGLGCPILAPSANFHGRKAPNSFKEIDKKLIALVDYAINLSSFEEAALMNQNPSTLVDTTKENVVIKRQGAISELEIKKAFGGARK
ncbi:MAG: threonylcarbamoyl-AMP synthase [Candidatus Woykebacteria bacterium RBG_16_44_10]|uniref:L-threonylcarbamoyladenylate synthase n=1 Tax=Candidatus Woykebacteria bacterium RBG_16_44_10 TaxID=1802597 RepID=A0A1G1WF92_9BACT|nr:MAG: threonylcarbamoyl-AMP synthase [Candidatus Woykebacteria bacterium RBG_16_44_10]